jgi:transposase
VTRILSKENKASELGPRLQTIPSVGPVISSALRARVTDAKLFENGRHLSAWIGLVPENDSTGGKVKQKGLSKKGDRYLRSLLVNGAMTVVRQAQKPGQASLGREASWPHVGQAGGDRDRQ